jgi:fumarate reductase subunit D
MVSAAKGGETMTSIFIKIAILAVLVILTLGVFPDRRKGGILAIATCIVAAIILHFVAP